MSMTKSYHNMTTLFFICRHLGVSI